MGGVLRRTLPASILTGPDVMLHRSVSMKVTTDDPENQINPSSKSNETQDNTEQTPERRKDEYPDCRLHPGVELQEYPPQVTTARCQNESHLVKPDQFIVYHPLSIHVLALLMPFTVLGTLARLGIFALVSYDGQSVFPLAWVQGVGCGVMGFALGLKTPITQFYGPLYIAIGSGFCGSLTTFSGWQLDVFLAWANASGRRRIWIYDVMDGLTRVLFTLAASLGSFNIWYHAASKVAPHVPALPPPGPIVRWTVTSVSIALYILTIPIFVRVNHEWRPLATAAILFSFPGTLSRYILSTYLNPITTLPTGTFAANEVATALLAAFHITQRVRSLPSPLSCVVLQGLIDGYCGCMSTVSTFAAEIQILKGRKALVYITLSLTVGQLLMLIILGPAWWAGRIHENEICAFG